VLRRWYDQVRAFFDYEGRRRQAEYERQQDDAARDRHFNVAAELSRKMREEAEHKRAEEAAERAHARAKELLDLQQQVDLAEATRHERTLELLETVMQRMQAQSTAQSDALIEVAKGVQENAKAINRWMGLFESTQGEGASHVVRPADEVEAADKRQMEKLRERHPELFGEAAVAADPYAAHLVANMFSPKDLG
jgi:hypothetical protein